MRFAPALTAARDLMRSGGLSPPRRRSVFSTLVWLTGNAADLARLKTSYAIGCRQRLAARLRRTICVAKPMRVA